MKYQTKQIQVEAITFDELVEHGKASGATLHGGMPWSFEYAGRPVTHETDDRYLISMPGELLKFDRNDMLVTTADGKLFVYGPHYFHQTYEPALKPHMDANAVVVSRDE